MWALGHAAYAGNLEEVQRLVQQDRGLLNANDGYFTPLTAAAQRGRVEVMRYLMEEGAQVDLRDTFDWTPLERACQRGHIQAVSLLIAHGADTATANEFGLPPLMFASGQGHTDVVTLLLAHGCSDIDDQDGEDRHWTALHHACAGGYAAVVRVLVEAGADPHKVDREGETALYFAVRRGQMECVALLQVRLCPLYHTYGGMCSANGCGCLILCDFRLGRSGNPGTSCARPAASAMPLPC
jgi:ankyrin repeat protein